MKTFAIVLAVLSGAVSAYGAAISHVSLMILGLLAAVCTMVWFGIASANERRNSNVYETLSPEHKILIRPIRKLHEDLEEAARTSKNSTAKVIAQEALIESKTILEHCIKLVQIRTDVKKGLYGRSVASADLSELRQKLEAAEEESEKTALQAAIDAREKESAHYGSMEASLEKIDATLRQAEASLAEIKARLAVASSAPEGDSHRQVELEETLTRLRSLSVSFDEAEDLLEGRTA